jgi:hypothetical protein
MAIEVSGSPFFSTSHLLLEKLAHPLKKMKFVVLAHPPKQVTALLSLFLFLPPSQSLFMPVSINQSIC